MRVESLRKGARSVTNVTDSITAVLRTRVLVHYMAVRDAFTRVVSDEKRFQFQIPIVNTQ